MAGMYMAERFGAWQVGNATDRGRAEFSLFFPDRQRAPEQFEARDGRPSYGDPRIASIRVAGSFQHHLGQQDWDFDHAPTLTRRDHPKGSVWSCRTDVELPEGFYEYKYAVRFQDGSVRKVGDPCARYGGSERQNSAFVIGGSRPADNVVTPLAGGRKHLRDLVVYELMIDDFTDEFRGARAPLDAVTDRLDYLDTELGVNAILFMPWTAWPGASFSWGYIPHQYFSVEYRYANALGRPAEKLSWLKRLVDACHARGIHVIMDGVFNHAGDLGQTADVADGFPYRWLYQDDRDSPYVGTFGGTFPGLLDLDYNNTCTQEFVRDVCFYWIDTFGIDGIRFDNTTNFVVTDGTGKLDPRGLPRLLEDIRGHVGDPNFSLTLEHLDLSAASIANRAGATSYWNNELYGRTFDYLWNGAIDGRIGGALDTHRGLEAGRVATTYIGNHDHSHVAWQAGARDNRGALSWYRVQPYVIALLTMPGAPMIHNGQEFSEDYWIMEDDARTGRRVKPRPLRWDFKDDTLGAPMLRLFSRLTRIRRTYAGLRSDNVHPDRWESWQTRFDPQGYGVDASRGLLIYHRWGDDEQGAVQRFMVVLNFSPEPQTVTVPFADNGVWEDLLSDGWRVNVQDYRLPLTVGSHWGHVFFQ